MDGDANTTTPVGNISMGQEKKNKNKDQYTPQKEGGVVVVGWVWGWVLRAAAAVNSQHQ